MSDSRLVRRLNSCNNDGAGSAPAGARQDPDHGFGNDRFGFGQCQFDRRSGAAGRGIRGDCLKLQRRGSHVKFTGREDRNHSLPAIEAISICCYCAICCTGMFDIEVAPLISCGHSLHPDLQNHSVAQATKTGASVESSAWRSIPLKQGIEHVSVWTLRTLRFCCVMQQSSVERGLFKYNTVYYSVMGS